MTGEREQDIRDITDWTGRSENDYNERTAGTKEQEKRLQEQDS
jgi:hypothetical protein